MLPGLLVRVPPAGAGAWTGAPKVGDGSGRTCPPPVPVTGGAVWVGVTFGATDDPTGRVWVGDRLGATEGGLVTPEDPPRDGARAGDVVLEAPPVEEPPNDPPVEAPPDDDPPDEDPPEEDPDCESAATGISNTAAMMKARMGFLLEHHPRDQRARA